MVATACVAAGLVLAFFAFGRPHAPPGLGREHGGYSVPLPGQTRQFSSSNLILRDDDGARPLFDATSLAPGAKVQDCITVQYKGAAPRTRLLLAVRASGALAPMLTTTVEQGNGGRFKHCDGFIPSRAVFAGTLDAMTASHAPQGDGWPLAQLARGAATTFRFTFQLPQDGVAQGTTAGADFIWTAHV